MIGGWLGRRAGRRAGGRAGGPAGRRAGGHAVGVDANNAWMHGCMDGINNLQWLKEIGTINAIST